MGLAGTILRSRTLAALTSPHGVDRYLELIDPMLAAHEVRARVLDVRRETDTPGAPVATLVLQPTSTWRGHRAGQHVQVAVDLPGSAKRLTRCFTISSAASAPGERFTLTIRAHEEGQVSKHLVHARPGQIVHLSRAQGDFVLPGSAATPSNDPILMISGGSGITPVMALVRTLLRDGYADDLEHSLGRGPGIGARRPSWGGGYEGRAGRKITFLHFARSPQDQIYAAELAEIAAADNDVAVQLRYGDHTFSEFELRRLVPNYAETDTWACGPAGLIDLVREAYGESPRLRVEFFKPPATASDSAEGRVTFSRSGEAVDNTGANLLEQAEAAGLTPEFGCRMGICFTCTTRKSEGTVRNVLSGAESSLPDEDIRICVSTPVGDCVVDL